MIGVIPQAMSGRAKPACNRGSIPSAIWPNGAVAKSSITAAVKSSGVELVGNASRMPNIRHRPSSAMPCFRNMSEGSIRRLSALRLDHTDCRPSVINRACTGCGSALRMSATTFPVVAPAIASSRVRGNATRSLRRRSWRFPAGRVGAGAAWSIPACISAWIEPCCHSTRNIVKSTTLSAPVTETKSPIPEAASSVLIRLRS